MKITGKRRKQLALTELTLTLTDEEVALLTSAEFHELSDLTQAVLRGYGLVNHRNKPTDLLRDIASTKAFITPAEHSYNLEKDFLRLCLR